jgi:cell division protein FtsI (penicillin-binding protein 3)
MGEYAAPVIGFLKDGKGAAGIERSQERALHGIDGALVGMADRTGNFLPWISGEGSSAPINGSDIVLTIQSDLQVATMKALKAQCLKHRATQGAAIVIEPQTGDILALASWPSYSPEKPGEAMASKISATPQSNPGTSRRFEPGSTFKVFTVAYALESGVITERDVVNCAGSKKFSVKTMSCSHDHGNKAHGAVTPARCIEVSCNVAAGTWAVRIGFDRFSRLIEQLGLLGKQDIGLTPEISGYLNYHDHNKIIQTANLGFGQAVNVTPIGLASAFTAFANNGRIAHPRLIKSVGGVPQLTKSQTTVFAPATARRMLQMLERVVQSDDGTGKTLRLPGVILAGKTGTAQKLGSSRLPGAHYVSSFVGYVPARKPRAVVLVMVDDPKQNGYYGGVVAGPVFKETAKALLKSFRLAPASPGAMLAVR